MRDMGARERQELDRHVTGNYGEDGVPADDEGVCDVTVSAADEASLLCGELLPCPQHGDPGELGYELSEELRERAADYDRRGDGDVF